MGARAWPGLILLACWLLAGCDAPLRHETLIDRLGTGSYSSFTVTFYRYSPAAVQGYAAGVAPADYLYERLLDQGPIERLVLTYQPKTNRAALLRTGNELDASRQYRTARTVAQRGPLEEVIRALKAEPDRTAAWFRRDLYAAADAASPDYFRSVDRALAQAINRQMGSVMDWQFVELSLTYPLPQSGPLVYTAEAALLPLTVTGGDAAVINRMLALADREFGQLQNPLPGDGF